MEKQEEITVFIVKDNTAFKEILSKYEGVTYANILPKDKRSAVVAAIESVDEDQL